VGTEVSERSMTAVLTSPVSLASETVKSDHLVVRRIGRICLSLVIGLACTTALWWAFVKSIDANPLVTKSPVDVWRYLFTDAKAAKHRSVIGGQLRITLRDALLGYVAGTVAAVIVSSIFVLRRGVEATFMPLAMLLRSVPLVAMVPIITLIFGRDILAVTIISGIVTFFPSLVNITLGLRSAPPYAADLVSAYGGSPFTVLRKVRLPFAMSWLFASMRIAVPGAVIGALLAEWLATGKGLGYYMLKAQSSFDYTGVWAAVAVLTFTSLVLYALVGMLETPVIARFEPDRLAE
jgi:ABC-type nitrate/sulfonate/bicarbonate transport system permease component